MAIVEIDASALDKILLAELDALERFPQDMEEGLTAWQREDMHRHYPNTSLDEDTAETDIWPRSRLTAQRHAQQRQQHRQSQLRRHLRGYIRRAGAQQPHSTRPILREELFDKLDDRMSNLMDEKLGWA